MDTLEIFKTTYQDSPIDALEFSPRTYNALMRNGISTIGDLLALSRYDLKHMRGLGEKSEDEILDKIDTVSHGAFRFPEFRYVPVDFHAWLTEHIKPNNFTILSRCYGLIDGKPHILEEVGVEYGISRERVRQIKSNCLAKIAEAFKNHAIYDDILVEYDRLALEKTRLDEINSLSTVYNNGGIAELLADAMHRNAIYVDKRLNHAWLVQDSNQFRTEIDTAIEWLESQPGYVPIANLSSRLHIAPDILADLAQSKIDGDYIALVNGYRKDGIDRVAIILKALREAHKPLSLDDISRLTNLDKTILRGYVYRIPGVVNVGNSYFALEENGYSNQTSEEIAAEYLEECGEPRHISDIVRHVQFRRIVSEGAVRAAVYVNPEVFTRFANGYVALTKWGYESDVEKKDIYEVPTREAILTVIKENSDRALSNREISELILEKYGDKASSVSVTVAAETKSMSDEGVLDRLGTTTYYYKLKK